MNTKIIIKKFTLISIFAIFILISTSFVSAASPSKVINIVNTDKKVVALTFDGYDGTNIQAILDVLAEKEVKATFFTTGIEAVNYPSLINQIYLQGHQIGNHSYSHKDFVNDLTDAQKAIEITSADVATKAVTGKSTMPFFRPPYGAYDNATLQVLGDIGYSKTITWNIESYDWQGKTAEDIKNTVLNKIIPGSIVLMHTSSNATNTPTALPEIIDSLKASGYSIMTVSELLTYDKSYVPDPVIPDPVVSTPEPTPAVAPTIGYIQYTVVPGDILNKISTSFGVSVSTIASINNIANINIIYVGQVLRIPASGGSIETSVEKPVVNAINSIIKYSVVYGDTLNNIASRYGTTATQLAAYNNMLNPNLIYIGQIISIPSVTTTLVPTVTSNTISTKRYIVKYGDTLNNIAVTYGVTVNQLVTLNNIANSNLIYVNQIILIP